MFHRAKPFRGPRPRSRGDLLLVIEAAYDLEGSDRNWLQGITDAVGPFIDAGYGAYGATVDASNSRQMRLGPVVSYRGDPRFVVTIERSNAALTSLDVKATYRAVPAITSATERVGVARWKALVADHNPPGIRDCAAVVAVGATGVGCMVNAPLEEVRRYPQRAKRVWARVVAHIVAMQRLREGLVALGAQRRAEGEAVLSPDGAVEHAVGLARSGSARDLLRAAALERERARGRLRQQDPAAAVEMWRALVGGRWSIVDRFDRDGRRFLIAHENEPEAMGPRSLTARERQVATHAALGHPNKLIAYELGLSLGSVSSYLNLSMRKLGLESRLDLARLLRPSGPASSDSNSRTAK